MTPLTALIHQFDANPSRPMLAIGRTVGEAGRAFAAECLLVVLASSLGIAVVFARQAFILEHVTNSARECSGGGDVTGIGGAFATVTVCGKRSNE